MLSQWLILAAVVVLLLYWFRHNCLAILRSKFARDYARQVASANRLSFLEIQYRLQADAERDQLDSLSESLLRDYRILTYLLRHTAEFQSGPESLNERMLMLDFRLMQLIYAMTRRLNRRQARRALDEMSQVLNHLANWMGQRTAPTGPSVSRA